MIFLTIPSMPIISVPLTSAHYTYSITHLSCRHCSKLKSEPFYEHVSLNKTKASTHQLLDSWTMWPIQKCGSKLFAINFGNLNRFR